MQPGKKVGERRQNKCQQRRNQNGDQCFLAEIADGENRPMPTACSAQSFRLGCGRETATSGGGRFGCAGWFGGLLSPMFATDCAI
jgi:hypothetical protein